MSTDFHKDPILYSPYVYPAKHWELNEEGQPTGKIIDRRRPAEFVTPIPSPKKKKKPRSRNWTLPISQMQMNGIMN
jgi:type III restriction enzyme